MILRNKLGWPIETIIGKPIRNFIKLLIHTNWKITWRMKNEGMPKCRTDSCPIEEIEQFPYREIGKKLKLSESDMPFHYYDMEEEHFH